MNWIYGKPPTKPGLYIRTTRYGYCLCKLVKHNKKLVLGDNEPVDNLPEHISWLGPLPEADTAAWAKFSNLQPKKQGMSRMNMYAGVLLDFVTYAESLGIPRLHTLFVTFCRLRGLDHNLADVKWWTYNQDRWKSRKRAEKKCILCGQPAVNKQHCEKHREQQRIYQQAKRAKAKTKAA